jgi:hypothetical protein
MSERGFFLLALMGGETGLLVVSQQTIR